MDSRLESAIDAVQSGDLDTARELLRELLQADSGNELAWLWLSKCAESDRERRLCLRQVLRINPENQEARQGLAEVDPPAQAQTGPVAPLPPVPEAMPIADVPPEPEPTWEDEPWPDPGRPAWVVGLTLLVAGLLIICALAAGAIAIPQLLEKDGAESVAATTSSLAQDEAGMGPTITAVLTDAATGIAPTDMGGSGPGSTPAGATPTDMAGSVPGRTPAGATPGAVTGGVPGSTSSGGGQPDLVVGHASIQLETVGACYDWTSPLGTRVTVRNTGEGKAGSFAVGVNGAPREVPEGLEAGEAVSLWFEGYVQDGDTAVVIDAAGLVAESDEENNILLQRLPIPTPPPPCTPAPEETAPPETVPGPAEISITHASSLAPIRVTSRSLYSDAPSSFLQVEVDAQGNARVAIDQPGQFEEWYVIDGVVYGKEGAVPSFSDPFGIFAPRPEQDRYTPVFPLHALVWGGLVAEQAEALGSEKVNGLAADKYQIAVEPDQVPASAWIVEGPDRDLAAAIAAGGGNEIVVFWVEPESGAVVKATWQMTFEDGEEGVYSVDVMPVEMEPFTVPE